MDRLPINERKYFDDYAGDEVGAIVTYIYKKGFKLSRIFATRISSSKENNGVKEFFVFRCNGEATLYTGESKKDLSWEYDNDSKELIVK